VQIEEHNNLVVEKLLEKREVAGLRGGVGDVGIAAAGIVLGLSRLVLTSSAVEGGVDALAGRIALSLGEGRLALGFQCTSESGVAGELGHALAGLFLGVGILCTLEVSSSGGIGGSVAGDTTVGDGTTVPAGGAPDGGTEGAAMEQQRQGRGMLSAEGESVD
jgi:hypothetical protein